MVLTDIPIMKKLRKFRKLPLLVIILSGAIYQASAQESHTAEGSLSHEGDHFKHQIAAGFGYTFIPAANNLGSAEAQGVLVPTVGLDYFYHIHPGWEIGFMADYELDHYLIVEHELERENALILALAGMYKATEHLGVFAGGGMELERHEHLAVFRLGTEYSISIGERWELVPKITYDFKEHYNTWSFSLSLAGMF